MAAPDDNNELVRRFYEEIDAGNVAAMDELVAPDFVDHDPPPSTGARPTPSR
jgi:ketosteroid isomerase-like protein